MNQSVQETWADARCARPSGAVAGCGASSRYVRQSSGCASFSRAAEEKPRLLPFSGLFGRSDLLRSFTHTHPHLVMSAVEWPTKKRVKCNLILQTLLEFVTNDFGFCDSFELYHVPFSSISLLMQNK